MKTHKVGGDALFTRRQINTITPHMSHSMPAGKQVLWFLSALTISFFISQSLILILG